jgi:hypothetical protein
VRGIVTLLVFSHLGLAQVPAFDWTERATPRSAPAHISHEVALRLSRPAQGLRATVVSLNGREVVAQADLPATVLASVPQVPEGTWELVISNAQGHAIQKQYVSVPAFQTVEVRLPEVAATGPSSRPISFRRLAHQPNRAAERLARQARKAETSGRLDEAGQLWRRTLEKDPEHYEALHRAAAAEARKKDYAAAAAYFARAVQLDDADPELLANYGSALFRLHRDEECLRMAELALRWDPESARSHALAGVALLRLGRVGPARGHLSRARGRVDGVEELLSRLENVDGARGHQDQRGQ